MTLLAALSLASGMGCGSSGSSNPAAPVGKYPLEGTATISDVEEVGDHAGTTVMVLRSDTLVASTSTDADGSFSLPSLSDGAYVMKVKRDFYSTVWRLLEVSGGLLVEPIGAIELGRTFHVLARTDSLRYTHELDSVHVWMTLKNENGEPLDLYNSFVIPYDFVVYDPAEGHREIWRWSNHRPQINDDRYDFIRSIDPADSIAVRPIGDIAAWGKADETGRPMPVGDYEIEATIQLIDDRGQFRTFVAPRRIVKLVP